MTDVVDEIANWYEEGEKGNWEWAGYPRSFHITKLKDSWKISIDWGTIEYPYDVIQKLSTRIKKYGYEARQSGTQIILIWKVVKDESENE